MIKLIALLIIFSTQISLASHSKGNGGLGYHCSVNNDRANRITLTLDIAENFEKHYWVNYFKNYDFKNTFVSKLFIKRNKEVGGIRTYVGKLDMPYLNKAVHNIISNRIDTESIKHLNLFSNEQLLEINKIAKQLTSVPSFEYRYFHRAMYNHTEDIGEDRTDLSILSQYGLNHCKLKQIAYLQKEEDSTYRLTLVIEKIAYIDYLNLEALLWHEIIYLVYGDKNSQRTRDAVSTIMENKYYQ